MGTMFQAADWFVRIRHKGGHVKITIWEGMATSCSGFLGPNRTQILERDCKNNIAGSGRSDSGKTT